MAASAGRRAAHFRSSSSGDLVSRLHRWAATTSWRPALGVEQPISGRLHRVILSPACTDCPPPGNGGQRRGLLASRLSPMRPLVPPRAAAALRASPPRSRSVPPRSLLLSGLRVGRKACASGAKASFPRTEGPRCDAETSAPSHRPQISRELALPGRGGASPRGGGGSARRPGTVPSRTGSPARGIRALVAGLASRPDRLPSFRLRPPSFRLDGQARGDGLPSSVSP